MKTWGVAMAFLRKSLVASVLTLAIWCGDVGADVNPLLALPDISDQLGDPLVLMDLAVKHEHAEGVPQDYLKAAALYCRAARLGHTEAQYALGWMYANGRGVARDDGIAAQLFAMAADKGHEHARVMMRYTRSDPTTPLPSCLFPEKQTISTDEDSDLADVTNFQKGPIFNLVHQLAPRYEVDPKLVLAVISVESAFNVKAISPKNAQGLMQLIPETAQRFRVKNPFDPAENIKGGMAYLQWLLAFFKGSVPLVAAAYNAGEKAVERHGGIPPYPETKDYVRKITLLYRKTTHPYQHNLVEPSLIALPVSYRK